MTGPKGNCFFRAISHNDATCLTPIGKPELIIVSFHHPYRLRHCPPDPGEHSFAFIRWTLNAIAILIVSAAVFIGIAISSTIHWG